MVEREYRLLGPVEALVGGGRPLSAGRGSGRCWGAGAARAALVAEHPFRERLGALHMLALFRSGRRADALASYQATRHALVPR